MPKWLVVGDIICGAFAHEIEAETAEEAEAIVEKLTTRELDSVSSEREFPRIGSVEEAPDESEHGTEGQDREGYSDDQDRESYTIDEDDEP